MAPPAGTLRVGRYFLALLLTFIVLYGIVFWPGHSHAPKLGLDLRGGAQIIYKAQTTNGKAPSKSSMAQAQSIINQRVNGLGVEQSQVVIQGTDEIVVSVPGKRADELNDVGKTALLNFRPLIAGPFTVSTSTATPSATASGTATTTTSGSPTGTTSGTPAATTPATASAAPSSGVSAQAAGSTPLAAGTTPAATTAATTPAPTAPAATASAPVTTPVATTATPSPTASAPALDTTVIGYSSLTAAQQTQVLNYNCGDAVSQNPKDSIVACDNTHAVKYMLGPVLVPGTEVDTASAQAPNAQNGSFDWTVEIQLKTTGQTIWSKYTAAHHNPDSTGQTPDETAADYVDFTLDDEVISNTNIESTINGNTQVSGNFTQSQATQLSNSLKYGALPLKFTALTSSTVTATLGTAQLKAGLLAGGIGLILVVIYSLLYYRALGLVTIASLIVSGGLTFASLVILGTQIGFTLTLAGIAGFIVAVGITADSFVVFFERIKDEVHEGRSMRVAVPRAWIRARRTILSADTVSFLAAAVLYEFAAGDVRGFAFTLGMSTILDLVVVFLFTHPLVSLLSRSAAFGSARFTGLDAVREGGVALAPPVARRSSVTPTNARREKITPERTPEVPSRGRSSIDSLDDLDVDVDVDEPAMLIESDEEMDPTSQDVDLDGADGSEQGGGAASGDDPPARTRTTPAPGSAAERAAARRAKMRAETATRTGREGKS